jgi:predicted O-methyltransferase YrrM
LPASLALPLQFLFDGRAPEQARDAAARIERIREQLAARSDVFQYQVGVSELGPTRWPERAQASNDAPVITFRTLATSMSVTPQWGMFLHLCAESFKARVIVEMGACVGISSAYLASASTHPRFITLEGSSTLAPIAAETLASISSNAEVVTGRFEETLEPLLQRLDREPAKIDLAFVDGHHDEAATLHYVDTLLPHLAENALVVLDDIHLYAEMWRAWQTVSALPRVATAVNVGRFGLLVIAPHAGPALQFDLARYTGWWPVGGARGESVRNASQRVQFTGANASRR